MGNQWSVTTSGGSGSDAAARGMKCSKVLMSFLEGVAPAFNPRRLPLTPGPNRGVVLLHCGCLSLIPFNPFIEFMNLEFGTTHQVQMC